MVTITHHSTKRSVNTILPFLLKVIALSSVLSVAVKYGGRYLPIPATSSAALVIVFAPVVGLAIALTQHMLSDKNAHAND